ncbi:hypothetical protein DIURU_003054 [Diutina rugosa]|uniref:Peroxisomal membrane protein PEX13 n=1 Tax=Diutina rugosa TaxID=5481 RepID=A0A642UMY2_DIURU|nr:uncharacterized protein DIURU_003054 [Diutina rugosa]KAA8902003.1 hypothetical protein DIURU_003054 [Diutina rugosa]
MSAPRAKPWEAGDSGAAAASAATASTASAAPSAAATVPERPAALTSDFNTAGTTVNSYGTGATGYGSQYGMGGYGSSYGGLGSSYGGYGSGMYGSGMYGGGYNRYGSMYGSGMYGGYGSGMYGSGMYGAGMGGMQGPGGFGEGTQATFQLIEGIIGAVGGFAQMLEATYMATHSSFFTMVSLAEQFGNLKNALGSILGIYALIRFIKKIWAKLTGSNYGINASEFAKFQQKQKKLEAAAAKSGGVGGAPKRRMSFKPLLLFLAASIGFPYLLSKAIQKINERQAQKQQMMGMGPNGAPFDPNNLQFAKALYEFNPENPQMEIELKPQELVAILSTKDPMGNDSQWWKVRSRSGKVGYVPSNFLQVIERKKAPAALAPAPAPSAPEQPAAAEPVDEKLKP